MCFDCQKYTFPRCASYDIVIFYAMLKTFKNIIAKFFYSSLEQLCDLNLCSQRYLGVMRTSSVVSNLKIMSFWG